MNNEDDVKEGHAPTINDVKLELIKLKANIVAKDKLIKDLKRQLDVLQNNLLIHDKSDENIHRERLFEENCDLSNIRLFMYQLREHERVGKGQFGIVFKSKLTRSASNETEIVALKVIHPFERFERDNITRRLQAIRDELGVMLKARELDHVVKIIGKLRYDMIIINIEQSLKYLICRCCRE